MAVSLRQARKIFFQKRRSNLWVGRFLFRKPIDLIGFVQIDRLFLELTDMPIIIFFLQCFLALNYLQPEDDNKIYNFGGLRKVQASIKKNASEYRVKVQFLPVQCFDSGMNKAVSFDKAVFFCTQALAWHLAGGKKRDLKVINPKVLESKYEEKLFTMTMSVPLDGWEFVNEKKMDSSAKGQIAIFGQLPDLFNSKEDHMNSLGILVKVFAKLPKYNENESIDLFYDEVAEFEGKLFRAFGAFKKVVESERFWFEDEIKEMMKTVSSEEAKILSYLMAAVKDADQKKNNFEENQKKSKVAK